MNENKEDLIKNLSDKLTDELLHKFTKNSNCDDMLPEDLFGVEGDNTFNILRDLAHKALLDNIEQGLMICLIKLHPDEPKSWKQITDEELNQIHKILKMLKLILEIRKAKNNAEMF